MFLTVPSILIVIAQKRNLTLGNVREAEYIEDIQIYTKQIVQIERELNNVKLQLESEKMNRRIDNTTSKISAQVAEIVEKITNESDVAMQKMSSAVKNVAFKQTHEINEIERKKPQVDATPIELQQSSNFMDVKPIHTMKQSTVKPIQSMDIKPLLSGVLSRNSAALASNV
jgi:hypothetical protein